MSRYSSANFFCGHCKEFLGKSTFYKHKRRFYNVSSGTWQLAEAVSTKTNATRPSRSFDRNDMPFEDSEDDFLEPSMGSRHHQKYKIIKWHRPNINGLVMVCEME